MPKTSNAWRWPSLAGPLSAAIVLVVLIAGCGSAVGPTSVNPTAAGSSETTSPMPIASVSADWSPVTVADPGLRLEIPANWQTLGLSAVEQQLKQQLPSMTGDLQKAWQYEISIIDSGQTKALFAGPSAVSGFTATIDVGVLTNADSLSQAVDREAAAEAALFGPSATRSETSVALPLGPAERVLVTSTPSGGSPSEDVEYVVRLNGSTIELVGSAPATDTAFRDVMTHVAESLGQQ